MSTSNETTTLPDSGTRHVYATGAQRDNRKGKGRYDLISPFFEHRLALRLELGAEKYKERNWEKGMNLSRFADALKRHTSQLISGDTSEDHAAAIAFNIMAYIHTEEMIRRGMLPTYLDDMPDYQSTSEMGVLQPDRQEDMDTATRMLWLVERETEHYKEARMETLQRICSECYPAINRSYFAILLPQRMIPLNINKVVHVHEEPLLVQYAQCAGFRSVHDYVCNKVGENIYDIFNRIESWFFHNPGAPIEDAIHIWKTGEFPT